MNREESEGLVDVVATCWCGAKFEWTADQQLRRLLNVRYGRIADPSPSLLFGPARRDPRHSSISQETALEAADRRLRVGERENFLSW